MSGGAGARGGKPLYVKIRASLLDRIKSGGWRPGQLIPNEFEVAAEFGVSQGTARKALDALAAEGLLVRRQGRGSFVVERTPADILFRFFQLQDRSGTRIIPAAPPAVGRSMAAGREARERLGLERGARVVVIERVRTRGKSKTPLIAETLTLPEAHFPGLAERPDIPNTVYELLQNEYGLIVTRADERISPVLADSVTGAALKVPLGTPLLKIERIAFGIDDTPLEWRVSYCNVGDGHYFARLR
jgi:GntR family transcriptional regulator